MANKNYRYAPNSPYYEKYKDYYINFSVSSRILNSNQDSRANLATPFWTKATLEAELKTYVADFKRNGTTYVGTINNAEMECQAIEKDFQRYQKQMVLQGREKPEEYPNTMLTAKLKAEARYDVILAERDWLENKLSSIADKEEVIEDKEILKYGPIAVGSFHGLGTDYYDERRAVATMDGMLLHLVPQSETREPFIIILDKRSPYSGMKVSDYYKMAGLFKISRAMKEQQRIKALKKKAIQEGKDMPQAYFKSASVVAKKDLPAWPSFAKHFRENGDIIEEQIIRKRTK